MVRVDLIVPLFNDAHRLSNFISEIESQLSNLPREVNLHVIFVNDGSDDNPANEINLIFRKFPISLIELSRNFGKESALAAGIDYSTGDAAIFMDVDLQDPSHLIPNLVRTWIDTSCDVVIAERIQPRSFRSVLSRSYLRILGRVGNLKINSKVGETRIIDKKVVIALQQLRETQRFTRGLLAWLGFEIKTLSFTRAISPEKSRFTPRKLARLAADGLFSFSLLPLRLITFIGLALSGVFLLVIVVLVYLRITGTILLPGYVSTLLVLGSLSSFQIVFLGIIGEYVGRILLESKNRPIYVIKRKSIFDVSR